MAVQKRERYAAVQELMHAGHSLNSISRQTGWCFRTVQRYAQAGSLDDLLATAERSSTLDRFKEYLLTRWNDGCTDTGRLHRELQGLGWRGSARTVHRYTHQLRGLTSTPPPKPVTPKPRKVARWLMTNPANLTAGDQVRLKGIMARCPELQATRRHVAGFASMMRELRGDQLPNWIAAVTTDELPPEMGQILSLSAGGDRLGQRRRRIDVSDHICSVQGCTSRRGWAGRGAVRCRSGSSRCLERLLRISPTHPASFRRTSRPGINGSRAMNRRR
ncbi:hypothetical protein [Dactylosporangium sp. NPDC050588]|uniref:hypothetical protein n=1 Tax=Dactylosporangium sp. NPDC050588 TaxID=3157211 RepID=UPI00340FA8DF